MTTTVLNYLARVVLTALLAAPLTGCSGSAGDSDDGLVHIVASTNVYGDLAATIGGDRVDVTSLLSSPSQDPHSFEADARDILAVSNADIVIENGGGYDDFMSQLLDSADNSPVVINAVDLTRVEVAEGQELNEHVWYDIDTVQQVNHVILEQLTEADPDHADEFEANIEVLDEGLQALARHERRLSATLAGIPVAITEPVPGYLLSALGLDNLTPPAFSEAVEEGEDVSVGVLDETLLLFDTGAVDALVFNEQTAGPTTDRVLAAAEEAGIPAVGVTETLPDGQHYTDWMTANVEAVAAALVAS